MKKLLFAALAVFAMMATSCSKEENLPKPVVVEQPTGPTFTLDENLLLGVWTIDSIHYTGQNGYFYELNQGGIDFSNGLMTWDTNPLAGAAYSVSGNTIVVPTDAADYNVKAQTATSMTMSATYVAPPWDTKVYFLSK